MSKIKTTLCLALTAMMLNSTLVFATSCEETAPTEPIAPDSSTAQTYAEEEAPEPVDTQTVALGIPTRLTDKNDFLILANPAQIQDFGTVYGEIWSNGNEWGGAAIDLPVGKIGIFIGRPYTGNLNLTGYIPKVTNTLGAISALPNGTDTLTNFSNAIANDPNIINLNALTITNTQLDLLYGYSLKDNIALGIRLSLAEATADNSFNERQDSSAVTANDGNLSTNRTSSDMQLSLGLLWKDLYGMEEVDFVLGLSEPEIDNKADATMNPTATTTGLGHFSAKSDNSINKSILIRGVKKLSGDTKLITALGMDMIDTSLQLNYVDDPNIAVANDDTRQTGNFKDEMDRTRLDVALHTKPNDKLKVIYAAGIAMSDRDITCTQTQTATPASLIALGQTGRATAELSNFGVPVTVAMEHQTWEKVATRFSASMSMFSKTETTHSETTYQDFNADGANDIINDNRVETVDGTPIAQAATIGLGLGIKPTENVVFDLALHTAATSPSSSYDFRYLVSRASLKYHF